MSFADVVSPAWYLPFVVPAAAQILTILFDNYLYKVNDFADAVNLLKNTNTSKKAESLKQFIESVLASTSYLDDRLSEQSIKFVSELTRRGDLDLALTKLAGQYRRTSKLSFYTAIVTIVIGRALHALW